MKISEESRRLVIDMEDAEGDLVFRIPPVNSVAGVWLMSQYIGVQNNVARELFTEEIATKTIDLGHVSLGKPMFKDPEKPTARELERLAEFESLWERVEELRSDEVNRVLMAAFYWQVQSGGIEPAKIALEGDFPKAEALWMESAGLVRAAAQTTTGAASASPSPEPRSQTGTAPDGDAASETPTPAGTNGTSSPRATDALSKLPPSRRSIRQNEPATPPQ